MSLRQYRLGYGDSDGHGLHVVGITGWAMSEVNRIAAAFLDQHIRETGAELVKVHCAIDKRQAEAASLEDVHAFIAKVQKDQKDQQERYDVTEVETETETTVTILRAAQPSYLVGLRRDGKPVWTYARHLALICSRQHGEHISKTLTDQRVAHFVSPVREGQLW